MAFPDFMCMGFQKCGTTTLYEILKQHPEIVLCQDVKEPMYYRLPLVHFLGGGKKFYRRRYFGHVSDDDPRKKGEINAGLTFMDCPRRVHLDISRDTKMIFMVRNPVDRAFSAYKYFMARGFLPRRVVDDDMSHGHARSFDNYVHTLLDHPKTRNKIMKKSQLYLVLSQSNYATCIEAYMRYYPLENMKFVLFEDFIQDEHAICRELYDFIGVSDNDDIQYNVKANEGKERPASAEKAKLLMLLKGVVKYFFYEFLCMARWAPHAYASYQRNYSRVKREWLKKDTDKSQVLPETRAYLMAYFDDEIERLSMIMDRDLKEVWGSLG